MLKKLIISGLSKISALTELRKFLKSLGLRKFLNYLDLAKFTLQNLEKFATQGKKLRKFQDKSRLKKFSDVMGHRMSLSYIPNLKII